MCDRRSVPARLERLAPRPWDDRFALPGEALERDIALVPELVSLAAECYEVSYDATLDIVTEWAAVIDGATAERSALTQLTAVV
jgi:hypothetical protein